MITEIEDPEIKQLFSDMFNSAYWMIRELVVSWHINPNDYDAYRQFGGYAQYINDLEPELTKTYGTAYKIITAFPPITAIFYTIYKPEDLRQTIEVLRIMHE